MFWILISLIILYYLIGILLPSTITIAGSLKMSGKNDFVYLTIKDFRNWDDWSIWNDDRTLEISLTDPPNKIGATYRWSSKIKELKSGKLTLIEATEPSELLYEWVYGKRKRGTILFNIEDLDNCSFVTCSLTIHNKRKIFARYFSFLIKKSLQENIEEVLLKIDERSL